MAEKKPDKREQFEAAVYELGLTLVDDYRTGQCRDINKTLSAIIEIFKISQSNVRNLLTGDKSNGI